jgi:hypothetical protein
MILRPDGLPADLATQPLTAAQVQWFIEGHALMRHVADLHIAGVSLRCRACYKAGLDDTVKVLAEPECQRYVVTCAHQGERRLPAASIVRDTGQLLHEQGWMLKCARRCAALGRHDGVRGENGQQESAWHVLCGCTDRVYHTAGAGRA